MKRSLEFNGKGTEREPKGKREEKRKVKKVERKKAIKEKSQRGKSQRGKSQKESWPLTCKLDVRYKRGDTEGQIKKDCWMDDLNI
ncbi:hypothetical protein ACLBWT_22710 [Paenibacillus sp. D51F]